MFQFNAASPFGGGSSILRQYPQHRIARFCFRGVTAAIRQVDEYLWLQAMFADIIEWRDEGGATVPVALPLVISRKVLDFAESLHMLDGAVALDDGQVVFAERVEQTGELREELGQIARGAAAGVDCHDRVHPIVAIGGQIELP